MFIAVEGIDGSGKSTAIKEIERFLISEKRAFHLTNEPSSLKIGTLIRDLLKIKEPDQEYYHKKMALLFAADRLDHLEKEINPNLQCGKIVVTDRYILSSIAYQSLTLPQEWVESINRYALLPDLLIYIKVSVDTALKRILGRGMEKEIFEKKEYLETIKKNMKIQ